MNCTRAVLAATMRSSAPSTGLFLPLFALCRLQKALDFTVSPVYAEGGRFQCCAVEAPSSVQSCAVCRGPLVRKDVLCVFLARVQRDLGARKESSAALQRGFVLIGLGLKNPVATLELPSTDYERAKSH